MRARARVFCISGSVILRMEARSTCDARRAEVPRSSRTLPMPGVFLVGSAQTNAEMSVALLASSYCPFGLLMSVQILARRGLQAMPTEQVTPVRAATWLRMYDATCKAEQPS